ncbi:Pectin degradation repressor protein KdgR [Mycolicibacterium vanbaalenii]|uniref:Pectin degradation repressor protein KdgR n=1 Tax=Mycolicibacterium vanbaalenii TaxID=110539 RepID=A0A5S9NKB7_MYCVN|nr:IclR family transcriptional regulator [Mycolicibacterium vanbaalenii]CAA0089369.1 Pectin degradation repressor protein KdgR [Mycolicibacterium vanbaalenii]
MSAQLQDCPPAAGIDRVDLILNAFTGPGQLTLAQIARRTGVPRSSVHRMLERLVHLGWLSRSGHQYRLGLRLFELGTLAVQQDRLHAAALPYLRELRRLTGHTVHLAILDGDQVIYLEKMDGSFGVDIDTRTGGRRSAATTSVGKVLVANAVGAASGLGAPPDGRLPDAESARSRREHAAIRLHGIAFDREETMPRMGCVGAPVGFKRDVVAAISISGPVERLAMDGKTINLVRLTGSQIYSKLGRRQLAI